MCKPRTRRGFTLVEVVVTLGIFSIAALMAVNLFVIFLQQQRRTVSQQELQNDARAVVEQIAQDIREGQINYGFYEEAFPTEKRTLFSALDGKDGTLGANQYLALLSSLNESIQYRLQGTVIERQQGTSVWVSVTPESLDIQSFTFSISPSEDPFQAASSIFCGNDNTGSAGVSFNEAECRWGTVCEDPTSAGKCQFARGIDGYSAHKCYCYPQKFGDVAPLQPRVTFSLVARRQVGQQEVTQTFETSITSRIYKSVERLNDYAP